MFGYANPHKFLKLQKILTPILGIFSALLLGVGLYYALFNSPADYLQGENVRIMYVHVPAAWLSLGLYASLAVAGLALLVWKHLLAALYIKAGAIIGASFALICLVTGALWGYPTWGTWWVWDARLTSMLILFFLYLGIILLEQAFENKEIGAKATAYLAIFGSLNLPIIKYSVEWWQTLHQPASISTIETLSNPKIHSSMLTPLLIMTSAFACYAAYLILKNMEIDLRAQKQAAKNIKTTRVKVTKKETS